MLNFEKEISKILFILTRYFNQIIIIQVVNIPHKIILPSINTVPTAIFKKKKKVNNYIFIKNIYIYKF